VRRLSPDFGSPETFRLGGRVLRVRHPVLGCAFVIVHAAIFKIQRPYLAGSRWKTVLNNHALSAPPHTENGISDVSRLPDLEDEIAKQIAVAFDRPLGPAVPRPPGRRFSREGTNGVCRNFCGGYRLGSSVRSSGAWTKPLPGAMTTAVHSEILLFPWRIAILPLVCATPTISRCRRARVWRRPSFIAIERLNWIRICLEGHVRPTLSAMGGPSKTSTP